mgnify:CR=1 FL=1
MFRKTYSSSALTLASNAVRVIDEKINFPDLDRSDKSTVSLVKKKGGPKNNEVWFYTVNGGGHDWPGSWGNRDVSATEEIWKFFNHHLK